jgi:large subunit ribosomal protein L4e
MAARPTVTVYNAKGESEGQVTLPSVFIAPIRPDIVQFVHTNINKNNRQAYAVSVDAGHQTSAESWGTGRAVARIPRVAGGGTSRSGQGAFGNMCRGGRMFAPTKTWRRWHRHVNLNQRRAAVVSALAASALPALVSARGHKINNIPEVPLVVSDAAFSGLEKTKQAVALLKALNAYEDVEHSKNSKKVRAGKGKARNRRYVRRRGPLVVYDEAGPLNRAFRNLPGVEVQHVSRLNLLSLAPGGHLGRFVIWTKGAFDKLDSVYGTYKISASEKVGYRLPRGKVTNADIARIINSSEVQSVVRPVKTRTFSTRKKNPLKNFGFLVKLNPYALAQRRRTLLKAQKTALKKERDPKAAAAQRKKTKGIKKRRAAYYKSLLRDLSNK